MEPCGAAAGKRAREIAKEDAAKRCEGGVLAEAAPMLKQMPGAPCFYILGDEITVLFSLREHPAVDACLHSLRIILLVDRRQRAALCFAGGRFSNRRATASLLHIGVPEAELFEVSLRCKEGRSAVLSPQGVCS
eukprot:2394859-Amphidinium_carterae.2